MRVATQFISSVLLLALALAAGTAWADTEPRQYFTASLTITTTQDEIENRPDTTSSGVLYYDSTYPGVRFEAHTTPDHAGDGTPFLVPPPPRPVFVLVVPNVPARHAQ